VGKKRVITIGAEADEEEKRKKEQKKKHKKLEKEREKEAKLVTKDTEAKEAERADLKKEKKQEKSVEAKNVPEKKEKAKSEVQPEAEKSEEPKEKPKKKAEKEEKAPKQKSAVPKESKPKVIKRGKAYKKVSQLIDKEKEYSVSEAIELVKKTSPVKFDASIEVHIRLGVDKGKSDQNVRGTVTLPNGSGKVKRVLVFTESKEKEAEDAGADQVGADELIAKVEKGFSDFDIVLATPDIMAKIGKLGKTLGQRGLMPNPKAGTITPDPGKLISEIKKGRTEFKMDPQGIIHMVIGKISFDDDKIQENVKTLMEHILKAKPVSLKSDFIKSIYFSSTMGPGIKVKY
jgi:large subunit ribosomal protein L1